MKNFIVAFALSVVLLSCTTDQSKKLDVVGQINQDMIKNPSAAGGTGTNYYICDDGDDANDGLSEETPWKTFNRGISQFNEMGAGDAVLFCRGGIFNVATTGPRIFNRNCSVEEPCIISDYYNYQTQVEDQRPYIKSMHTGDLFDFEDGGNADHDEGYLIENLIISGLGPNEGKAFLFYNDVDDVLLSNLTISGFKVGVHVAGSNAANEGSDMLNERIEISQVNIDNAKYITMGPVVGAVVLADLSQNIEPELEGSGVYFVCNGGDDNSSGDSPFTPLETFEKALSRFNSLPAGGGIYFCKGGVFPFSVSPRLYNTNCSKERPCVIGAYETTVNSSQEDPVIMSLEGNTVFDFEDGGNADPDGGYVVKNLILKSDIPKASGIFIFNDVDDLVLDHLVIDGFRIGVSLAGNNPLNEGANEYIERFELRDSNIVNNSVQGILGGCSDCIIDNNLFDNNGYQARVFNHNMYLSFHGNENVVVSRNILRNSAIFEGKCSGVSLVVHGEVSYLTIEDNVIEEKAGAVENGCWGVSVDTGYAREESFSNVIIKGNNIINVGNVAIGCASCVNVLIENNKIYNANDTFSLAVIKIPSKIEDSIKSEQVIVRNNIMTNMNSAIHVTGIDIALEVGSPVVEGNKLFTTHDNQFCQKINGENVIEISSCQSNF